jgi:hypothetical protein
LKTTISCTSSRNRTSSKIIGYDILVLFRIILQKYCESIIFFTFSQNKPFSYLDVDAKYKPKKISDKKKKIKEYYCIQKDETERKICSGLMLF